MNKLFTSPTDKHLIIAFLAITFSITWTIIGSYVFFPAWMEQHFGLISGSHPLFVVATWAPAIASLTLLLRYRGISGIYSLLSRLLIWRCSLSWWLLILLVIPLIFMIGSLIKGGELFVATTQSEWFSVLPVFFMMLFLGPIEELGWRGFLQPLLQRHVRPLFTGLLIGLIWGIWHLPAFYLAGVVFSDWDFFPFFIGNITLAVLVTPLFNISKGSLLLPVIFHWQLINPYWPDAQPWDTWLLLLVTFVIVLFNRKLLLDKSAAGNNIVAADSKVPHL